ncbi:MAG: hypothetical protein ACLP1D_22465 [Xanthobacteraceae bacterium]|jgi:hypothetical protein
MMRTTFALLLTFFVTVPAFAAGTRFAGPTPAMTAACRGDVMRFCRAVARDDVQRHNCMAEHFSQLSKGCANALSGN